MSVYIANGLLAWRQSGGGWLCTVIALIKRER